MKRFLSLLAAVMLGGTMMAQAVIKFDKSKHDFGSFSRNKIQVYEFEFTNTGNEPLVIQQAFGSCGCTVPQPPKDPIAPGQKGKIKVSYNGRGQYKGPFRKSITVRSNASNAISRIYITGVLND